MAGIDKDSVEAFLNTMPPGPHTFYLIGKADQKLTLARARLQGINPDYLLLDIASASGGPADFRYDENPAQHDYTHATIRQSGDHVTVEVQIVS